MSNKCFTAKALTKHFSQDDDPVDSQVVAPVDAQGVVPVDTSESHIGLSHIGLSHIARPVCLRPFNPRPRPRPHLHNPLHHPLRVMIGPVPVTKVVANPFSVPKMVADPLPVPEWVTDPPKRLSLEEYQKLEQSKVVDSQTLKFLYPYMDKQGYFLTESYMDGSDDESRLNHRHRLLLHNPLHRPLRLMTDPVPVTGVVTDLLPVTEVVTDLLPVTEVVANLFSVPKVVADPLPVPEWVTDPPKRLSLEEYQKLEQSKVVDSQTLKFLYPYMDKQGYFLTESYMDGSDDGSDDEGSD